MKKYILLGPMLVALFLFAGVYLGLLEKPSFTGMPVMDTRTLIVISTPEECDFNLTKGWNQISIPCISKNSEINNTMASINYTAIIAYDASDDSDKWKAYKPDLPGQFVSDLKQMSRHKGYYVYVNESTRYYLNATSIIPNLIRVFVGWNFMGYPTMEEKDIIEAMSSLYPDYQIIYRYNKTDDHWSSYSWNNTYSNQELNSTLPYFGYWIYMDTDSEWMLLW